MAGSRPDAEAVPPAFTPSEPPTITIPVILPLKQHLRAWMLLSGVLGIMLIAALVIVGYLWNVNGKWQAQVTSLTSTGYDLGDRIADHQAQIRQLESTNGLLTDQLATAKDRVLSLSGEKASWSDETAFAQQQVALLSEQVAAAQSVVAQLGRCIDGEQQLVIYIEASTVESVTPSDVEGDEEVANPGYTAAEIEQYRQSVNELCGVAANASADFQKSLTE